MNADEMRIAVAEACGWLRTPPDNETEVGWGDPAKWPHYRYIHQLPNYTRDLNAIRDAALSQPLEVRKAMRYYLWQLEDQMTAHLASAETMTKALLLALAKWKEPWKEPSCTPRG